MDSTQKVIAFINNHPRYKTALTKLRNILLKTEVEETIKWGMPVYTVDGKNVLGIGAFKNHFGIWFYQGALLQDKHGKLINAQEGKTVAMRQWRMESEQEIDEKMLLQYILEAIENQKMGRVINPSKPVRKTPPIPRELKDRFAESKELAMSFKDLTPGKQKEYIEYVDEAKKAETKMARLDKITPMILEGLGLNDKYKKSS